MNEHMDLKLDLKEQKAKSFIKVVMIVFDYFYPDEKLNEEGLCLKKFLRFKIIEGVHKIKTYEKE